MDLPALEWDIAEIMKLRLSCGYAVAALHNRKVFLELAAAAGISFDGALKTCEPDAPLPTRATVGYLNAIR